MNDEFDYYSWNLLCNKMMLKLMLNIDSELENPFFS